MFFPDFEQKNCRSFAEFFWQESLISSFFVTRNVSTKNNLLFDKSGYVLKFSECGCGFFKILRKNFRQGCRKCILQAPRKNLEKRHGFEKNWSFSIFLLELVRKFVWVFEENGSAWSSNLLSLIRESRWAKWG